MIKKLSDNEISILKMVRDDSRISLVDMSRKIKLKPSTIHYIFCKLKNRGIITKKTTVLEWEKLGYGIRVNIAFMAKQNHELIEFLKQNRNVNSVFRVNKKGEFLIDTIFRNMKNVYDFLEKLDSFNPRYVREYHIIENISEERFFTQ